MTPHRCGCDRGDHRVHPHPPARAQPCSRPSAGGRHVQEQCRLRSTSSTVGAAHAAALATDELVHLGWAVAVVHQGTTQPPWMRWLYAWTAQAGSWCWSWKSGSRSLAAGMCVPQSRAPPSSQWPVNPGCLSQLWWTYAVREVTRHSYGYMCRYRMLGMWGWLFDGAGLLMRVACVTLRVNRVSPRWR